MKHIIILLLMIVNVECYNMEKALIILNTIEIKRNCHVLLIFIYCAHRYGLLVSKSSQLHDSKKNIAKGKRSIVR